jgi:hypothetical protein
MNSPLFPEYAVTNDGRDSIDLLMSMLGSTRLIETPGVSSYLLPLP